MIKQIVSNSEGVTITYVNDSNGETYDVDITPENDKVLLHFSGVRVEGHKKVYANGAEIEVKRHWSEGMGQN